MRKLLLIAAILALSGCAAQSPVAKAVMAPTQGNTTKGIVSFAQQGHSVHITAQISGLTPGAHGFHIHDKGDCSAHDGTSAGGHFNPFGKPHGDPAKPNHHAGDLPMIVAGSNGVAKFDAMMEGISLKDGDKANILNRSVIIHAMPDDYTTQPTGNSGARVACGIITLQK